MLHGYWRCTFSDAPDINCPTACCLFEDQAFPDVFSITDEGVAKAIEEDVPEEALDSAAEAKDGCPVGAIEET